MLQESELAEATGTIQDVVKVEKQEDFLRSARQVERPAALFEGDNVRILDSFDGRFNNRISCIYLDPPYNNGEAYRFYQDDASHQDWLAMMETTLRALKPLLAANGSIWISIDDGEMHYLKVLCDTVFGRSSYVATIVWQQRNTRENRTIFSKNHEYILVYSPDPDGFKKKRNGLPVTPDVLRRYNNPDNDPRGPWQSVSANVQDGHAVPSQFYEIVAPNGKRHKPPLGRCWIYNEKKMLNEIEAGNIWFGRDGNGVPRLKKFFSERKNELAPETLWPASFAGTNMDAKKQLRKLGIYDKALFDTPKPEELICRILQIATNPEDIVLDAFAGSGTTLAVAHKMGRSYIGIEQEAASCKFIVRRMNLVLSGETGGISKKLQWAGGGHCAYIRGAF